MPGMRLFSSHQHNSACNGAYEQQLPLMKDSGGRTAEWEQ